MNITLKNSTTTAKIATLGAELQSLQVNNKEYIWEGNPTFWGKHSPVLFPIVGALKNNSYLHNNQTYELQRHGFAREMEFKLVSQTDSCAVFSIKSNEETKKKYPFDFEFQLKYTLEETKINIAYYILNLDDQEMYFSIGAHPAISLPQNFENYNILFKKDTVLHSYLLENNLLSKKTSEINLDNHQLSLNYNTFAKDALVFKKLNSKEITILENQKPYIKVEFEDFPNLGIWTVNRAPFICIEPWHGYADTTTNSGVFNEKEGIIKLEPEQNFQTEFSIEIL